MRVPRVTPVFLRRLTTLNVLLLLAVVVSGAIVRLSNSGLGCRDRPNCSATQFVSVATDHAANTGVADDQPTHCCHCGLLRCTSR